MSFFKKKQSAEGNVQNFIKSCFRTTGYSTHIYENLSLLEHFWCSLQHCLIALNSFDTHFNYTLTYLHNTHTHTKRAKTMFDLE